MLVFLPPTQTHYFCRNLPHQNLEPSKPNLEDLCGLLVGKVGVVRCWSGFDGFFFFFLLLVAGFLVELDTVVMWLSFGGAMMAVVG